MKKRIISLVLILVMAIGFMPTLPIASAATYGDLTYEISNGEVTITDCKESVTTVDIPATIEGYPVTSIGNSAFEDCSRLISIIIPDGVTYIGRFAFEGCSYLTSITIPDGVMSIRGCAFRGCSSLTSVTIPDSVTSIEGFAFERCSSLTSVTIPDGVTSIDDYVFLDCSSLTSVTIPDGVTSIGDCVFYDCSSLTSVTIPDSVTSIGDFAFRGCSSLTSVTIPDGVTSIGDRAFYGCSSLTSVTIPDGVTSIGDYVFYDCSSLTSVTIPDGVTSIGDRAFEGCSSLTSVTIPDGVTSIGDYVFYDCSSLTSVTIPDGVTSIGDRAFEGCSNLTSITIPSGITSIGFNVFYRCDALTDIYYGGNRYQYYKLYNVPNRVNLHCDIKEYSFPINENLTASINETTGEYIIAGSGEMPEGSEGFSSVIPSYLRGLIKSVEIKSGITNVGSFAFSWCKNLTSVTIPDGVMSIGNYAFISCSSLKKLSLPKQMIMIGEGTFTYSRIKVLYISKEITLIKNGAFNNTDIKYVYYGGSEADKQNLTILPNNDSLNNATWVYNATGLPECQYDNACDTECNICGEIRTVPAHVYTNSCDTSCNVCGAIRTTTHSFGGYGYNNDASEKADGTKTRTCSVCGHKETVTATGTKWKSSFTDIKTKDFYYKPTLWAVANNITTGTSKTTFSPADPCTRGQVVTFLWRAAGCPEPTSTTMPFTDVGGKAFYRKAVLWAVEQGITSGTSATTFGPNETCTRGQIATFLWRAKGKPAPKSSNMPFVDVSTKNFAYKAVLWAVENKITSGTSKTTFAPSEPCTRGQIVTFLYRAYK